jgi:predicted O-methyltransferase YrrM
VAYTQKMVDFAGLGNKVSVMLGSVSTSTELFQESGLKKILLERHKCDHFNVLFIDHDKARYLEDLQIIESNGLLKKGKVYRNDIPEYHFDDVIST